MKKVTFLILLTFLGLNDLIGQILNPITIRQTLHGQVIVEITPFDGLTQMEKVSPPFDSSNLVKCIEYKVSENGDTSFRSTMYFNYLEYPRYSADVFTFQTGIALTHFPKTIERTIKIIDSDELELTDIFWTGTKGNRITKPHILKLKYNNYGQLVKIRETYIHEVDKNITQIWNYKYKDGRLKSISVGDIKNLYQYDDHGNLISAICYSGKNKFKSPYLNADSLASLHSGNLDTYKIRQLLNYADLEIYQLVYYNYSKGALSRMVCYDSNYGIQKSTFLYDSLQRISSVNEEHVNGGLKLNYKYEQNSNRLQERSERVISDCFTRGCSETEIIETYFYNSMGMITKIDHKTYNHNSNGSKTVGYDTGRGKLFQYR